ncbi:AC transposase [Ceratobasidium sp. AG-Ba]|nr:AC transposase [Ceratobasidium sp. AG-Ba]
MSEVSPPEESPTESPPFAEHVPAAPRRMRRARHRRRNAIHSLSDVEAWPLGDQQIIASWKSEVYKHYSITLIRHYRTMETDRGNWEAPDHMEFAFQCKSDPEPHPIQYRRRSETHRGTGNLKTTMTNCETRNRQPEETFNPSSNTQYPTFSYAMHLAYPVMVCACHYVPFAGTLHLLVRRHIELLRPGTHIPDSSTLSRKTRLVYEAQTEQVRDYFKDVPAIHLSVDGWTSPTASAYLGLVVHWHSSGRLWHAVLEMIYLESKHTGEYLATKTGDCLKRFGLDSKLVSVCLDNASNNDTLTEWLPRLIESFIGPQSRTRCAAHVVNLIVKAFTDHFTAPKRQKRKVAPVKSTRKRRQKGKAPSNEAETTLESLTINSVDEDTDNEGSNDHIDDAQQTHDSFVIKECTEAAFSHAKDVLGLVVTEDMRSSAREIITKCGKLAKRVHQSPEFKYKLEALVDSLAATLHTGRRTLARYVSTRWNSVCECLESHRELRTCVEMLTADTANNLRELQLSDHQWILLDQMVRVLKASIHNEVTLLFSQSDQPLLHEVIPVFLQMSRRLGIVRDDKAQKLDPLIRIAAHSSLLVLEKYFALFKESEVYWIALVMCPNHILQWLRDNGWPESDIQTIREMITDRFHSIYPSNDAVEHNMALADQSNQDEWMSDNYSTATLASHTPDTIEEYLSTEPVAAHTVGSLGGPFKYSESQMNQHHRPQLAQFALRYLSAPASSVDVERAFSCGRLTISHLQHQMSPDTFCAKMALKSWYDTPLLPNVESVAQILAQDHAKSLD